MGALSQLLPRLGRGACASLAVACQVLSACPAGAAAPAAEELTTQVLPGSIARANVLRGLRTPSAEHRWNGLPAFGRELFSAGSGWSALDGAPVGPDYVLGPGDQLLVFVSSLADTSYALTLDREGKVFLPRVGSTFLWGLGFADAEHLVRSRLETVYRNARVQVSMGRMRTLEVYVLGNAVRPGKLSLTGAATAFHAIAAAGGPSRLGSMRNIRVMRSEREAGRLDLYPMLMAGDRRSDPRLENGDVVFVELSAAHVGVQGEVTRPAVYEIRDRLSLRGLLDMAGGPTTFADLARVRIERVTANGGFSVSDVELDHGHGADPDTLMLQDQDLITVLPLAERTQNVVTLDGYVRHPGEYELAPGMKLSQLVQRERLVPEADFDHAEFRRIDPSTLRAEVRAFSPRKLWAGAEDWPLQPLDAVTVFSSARMPATVVLQGEVTRPGSYSIAPGDRLSTLLHRAGGTTSRGSLRAAVFRRPGSLSYLRALRREQHQRRDLELNRQRIAAADDSVAVQAIEVQIQMHDAQDADVEVDRVVLKLDERGRWQGTARDLLLEDGDQLYVPLQPTTVVVMGSVMNPGTLAAEHTPSAMHYIKRAGGVTRDADMRLSYVVRAGGEAVPLGRAGCVEAGDAIVVAPRRVESRALSRGLANASQFLLQTVVAAAVVVAAARR
jgi:protein involved in polysaccharide export with SLBB domain